MDARKILLMVVLVCLVCFCGCQQECVTKKDKVIFPIVIYTQTDRVCNDNGTLDVRKKGGACILAHWNYNRTYDANGVLMKYDDRSGIWPFYNISTTKTENSKRSSGTILLFFNFDNKKENLKA